MLMLMRNQAQHFSAGLRRQCSSQPRAVARCEVNTTPSACGRQTFRASRLTARRLSLPTLALTTCLPHDGPVYLARLPGCGPAEALLAWYVPLLLTALFFAYVPRVCQAQPFDGCDPQTAMPPPVYFSRLQPSLQSLSLCQTRRSRIAARWSVLRFELVLRSRADHPFPRRPVPGESPSARRTCTEGYGVPEAGARRMLPVISCALSASALAGVHLLSAGQACGAAQFCALRRRDFPPSFPASSCTRQDCFTADHAAILRRPCTRDSPTGAARRAAVGAVPRRAILSTTPSQDTSRTSPAVPLSARPLRVRPPGDWTKGGLRCHGTLLRTTLSRC